MNNYTLTLYVPGGKRDPLPHRFLLHYKAFNFIAAISMEPRDSLVEGLAQTREEKNKEVYNYIHNLANQHQVC